jgi:hypothetical protein
MKYKFWWMQGEKVQNFGDVLTPKLLEYYEIPFEYEKSEMNAICIGSIASKATDGCIVLGSGIAWQNTKLNPKADWRFVRGPLTRNALIKSGGNCPEIYGDPALLLPIFCEESKKEHDIGIIPHYKEYRIVKEKYPNMNVINLNNQDPLYVAKEISKCRKTISSSLHGIIASHAYEIPCAWVKFSDLIIGDDTKFKDHFQSVGLESIISNIDNPFFQSPVGFDTKKIENIFLSLK